MTEIGSSAAFFGGILLTVAGVGLLQSGKSDVVLLDESEDLYR